MKFFLVVIFFFLQVALFAQQQVSVFVSYTNNYCGGARPTNDILTKYDTPAKLPNFKIKLVAKKTSIVVTDSAGNFTHKLKPGIYSVFLTEEVNKSLFLNYDPFALKC